MEDLTLKKPGTGIVAKDLVKCVGKKVKKDLPINHFLDWSDFES